MGIKHFKILGIGCSYGWHCVYTGTGFTQGIGFDLMYKALTIGKLKVITDIYFDHDSFWFDRLKDKLKSS